MTGEPKSSTHPPLPPTEEDNPLDWLRLLRSRRVGIATFWRLLAEHGTARAALAALPDIARQAGVSDYSICPESTALAELKAGHTTGAKLICGFDPEYPKELSEIADAPPMLWCLGDTKILTRPKVALVGARNASSLGTRMARKMAAELGEAGYVVVSGLARGVDTAAHQATVQSGTIAVLAGGVNMIYPAENTDLAHEIAVSGLRISDQPMGTQAQARHFPARNRIISGLSQAVVVIEAAAKSGSLITARNALDQGRDVLAVPGHPFDGRASGCNMLLRDGAILVRNAADVIDHIGTANNLVQMAEAKCNAPLKTAPATPERHWRETASLHQEILDRLGPSPMAEDQLIRDLCAPSHQVAPALVTLELDGHIVRQAGGLLSKAG